MDREILSAILNDVISLAKVSVLWQTMKGPCQMLQSADCDDCMTLIPTRISNYIHYKVWNEITCPFLKFDGATVEV